MSAPRWLTDDEQRAWRAYRRMVLLVDGAVARELTRDTGLSMPDYQVLSSLSETPGNRRRLTELAGDMQWSASRLSHHVTRMAGRGLVTRRDCPDDARAAWVELTDAGWAALRAAAPHHVASVRRHLVDLLDPDDLAALGRVGETVARHFGEDCLDLPRTLDGAAGAPERRDGPDQSAQPDQPDQPDQPGQSANRSPVSRS